MDNRRKITIFIGLLFFCTGLFAKTEKDLIDDLFYAGRYGYKTFDSDKNLIDYSENEFQYRVLSGNKNSYAIFDKDGFFRLTDKSGNYYYTRCGEFYPHLPDDKNLYARWDSYWLSTEISAVDSEKNLDYTHKTLLFYPTPDSKIERDGPYFKFSKVEEREGGLINGMLEVSNVDPIATLLSLKKLYLKKPKKNFEKIEIVNAMLNALVYDKMHAKQMERNFYEDSIIRYNKNWKEVYQLKYEYMNSWSFTFSKYIKKLYE